MREYLTTTTLGDLTRKANTIEIPQVEETAQSAEIVSAANSENISESIIRGPLGEINQ